MSADPSPNATLVAMRAAHHPEASPRYDRVVFEFRGPMPLLRVEYVSALIEDGSGQPVVLPGNAIVRVQISNARAHTDAGEPTVARQLTPNLPNVHAVVSAGDFEGIVSYGIALDHQAQLRVMTLERPCRVVVDVMSS